MVGGDNWASKRSGRTGVAQPQAGTRAAPSPAVPNLLNGMAALGMVFVVWGVVALDVWPTLLGCALVYLAKLWFLDRMVWLYEEMKTATREGGSERRRTS